MAEKNDHGGLLAGEAGELVQSSRKPLLSRVRVQFFGLLLVSVLGILLPLALQLPITILRWRELTSAIFVASLLSAWLAASLGHYLLRQMNTYPGTQTSAYVFPTMLATFSLISIALLFLRVDYSRYVLIAAFIASNLWLTVVFFVNDRRTIPVLALIPKGNPRDVTSLPGVKWVKLISPVAATGHIDGVVADLHADLPDAWERFVAKSILAGIPVYDVKNVMESLTGRVDIEHLSENGFGGVLPSKAYLKIKRLIDLALAALLLPVFLVVILATAIAIRLETPGPAFFMQRRIGYRAGSFKIYKLRSMHAMEGDGQLFTQDSDPRITRLGKFIRKYRIDEMPQIFNIIKGDMSWIGPRPEATELAEWYEREIPFYIYRHAVRPGLSGWAQVNQGNVAEIDSITVKLQYDFYYAKYFSPTLDLLIFIKTIGTVVTGFGSK
jgi:lipopolysaccharide/colanic/teichoic acid biosynthesis glycosyltransferase